jgi:hypothetical protein
MVIWIFAGLGSAQVVYFEWKYGASGCFWCLAYRWSYLALLVLSTTYRFVKHRCVLKAMILLALLEIGLSVAHVFQKVASIPCKKNLADLQNSWACMDHTRHLLKMLKDPVGWNAIMGLIVLMILIVTWRCSTQKAPH